MFSFLPKASLIVLGLFLAFMGIAQDFQDTQINQLILDANNEASTHPAKGIGLLDEAIRRAESTESAADVAWVKLQKARYYISIRKSSQVSKLVEEVLKSDGSDQNIRLQATVVLGEAYSAMANYDSAIIQFERAVSLADSNNLINRISSLERLGTAYENIGNYALALKSYISAMELAQEVEDQKFMALLNLKIGALYLQEPDKEKGQIYFVKALRFYQKLNDDIGTARTKNRLGRLKMDIGQLDSAEALFNEALEAFESKQLYSDEAKTLDNLGTAALKQGDRDKAIGFHQRALELRETNQLIGEIPESFYNLSNVHLSGKRYNDALIQSRMGLTQAIRTRSGPYRMIFNKQLYDIFRELNYGDSALVYLERYNKIHDSMSELNNRKLAIRLRTEFEDSQRQRELQSLREADMAKNKIIKNQRLLSLSIGIICVLSLAMVFVMYNRYRLKTKVARVIAAKNKENVLLLKELHHRVKNNLQFIASMISIQRSKIKDYSTRQELKESLQKVTAMALVHNKLYRKSASGNTLSFKAFLAELTDSLALSYGYDTDQIKVLYGWKTTDFDIDTYNALGLILNEMVTNSFKHCDDDDVQVQIIFKEGKDFKRIIYTDNGPGIDHELTRDQQNTGTVLINLLAEEMNGSIEFIPNAEGEKGIKIVLDLKNKSNGKPAHSDS